MITQQELERRLLAACNCLRGQVDPTDYKAYIFPAAVPEADLGLLGVARLATEAWS